MGKLDGLVTLVTGAGSGIGEAIATVFAEEGATVVVNDVSHDAADAAVASLPPVEGGDHVPVVADVSSSEQVRSMFAQVGERFGRLDVLVNNAGIVEGAPGERERLNEQVGALRRDARSGKPRTVHWDLTPHISDESWDRMIGVHLSGTFYCCREAIPLLVAAGSGSIVNMSSIGAIRGGAGFPHYSAAKAGILGFTRSLAGELGSREIRVNAILPGNVDTPMTRYYSDEWWASVMAGQPIARMGRPREIAMTALFLASDDASFYTGQALSPNGGIVMFS